MKRIIYLIFCLLVLACSKNDGEDNIPTPPDSETKTDPNSPIDPDNTALGIPNLLFPEIDQLCLDTNIVFDWSEAADVVSYQIQISTNRAFTGIVEDQVVSSSNLPLVLEGGQDYYWRVLSIDENNEKSEYSPDQAFFVQGEATSNYVPFIPSLTSPDEGSEQVSANITLQWETSDLDEDFLIYDIYLSTNESPELFQENVYQNNIEVTLESNQTYYWQVHVSDGVSKSIGEIWSFSIN